MDPATGHELVAFVQHIGLVSGDGCAVEQIEELQVGLEEPASGQPPPLADGEVDQVLEVETTGSAGRCGD